MYQLLPESQRGFVALQLSGKLDASDYEGIIPILESRIREHGKLRLYWEMRDFEGWTLGGLWADGGFDRRHANDFTHIALVGEKRWQEWMTKLMKPFTSAEVKYFDLGEREQALSWTKPLPQPPASTI